MPQPITDTTTLGQTLHEWTIQEYQQHARGTLWYVVMSVFAAALIIYAVVMGNFLFALIIMLTAIILFLQHHQEPLQVPVTITDLGLALGGKFYAYSEIKNFYIIYQPPRIKSLYIVPKSPYRPTLRIPLLDENPLDIRDSLLGFLTEDTEKEEEPNSDAFVRNWKIH